MANLSMRLQLDSYLCSNTHNLHISLRTYFSSLYIVNAYTHILRKRAVHTVAVETGEAGKYLRLLIP